MPNVRVLVAALLLGSPFVTAQTATIRIDAGKKLHRITPRFVGVNLEDLNYQTYGGLYSQLLYGESFQEHIDSAVLGLSDKAHLMVFVGENDRGQIELWGFRGRHWEHAAAREALGLPPKPGNIPVALDELPAAKRQALIEQAAAGRQVSRYWKALERGNARASFRFERAAPFVGWQSQRVTFDSGSGEVGIDNAGLNGLGINLVAGKPYEGVLRIRADRDTKVYVSLLDASGSEKLAEKLLDVKPGKDYQRLEFTLVPSGADKAGRFAISLKQPGSVTIGYAFLQPGAWGRFAGLPLRKDLVNALIAMGVRVVRYDGSMVNKCPDGQLYKWKEMIGPRDLRKPYRGNFNPYASHGFGIFDFLNLCEKAGFLAVPGVRTDETPADMVDFVEYVNGPADSPWGRKRAADGHPAPYNLTHLEIGNEDRLDDHYAERFEMLARAIWAKAPAMVLVASHNLASAADFTVAPDGTANGQLRVAARLVRFAQEQKGAIWWDAHYTAAPPDASTANPPDRIAAMIALHESIRQLVPGYNLPIAALEENGQSHDMQRALTHARNQNAFARMGDYVVAVGVANTFQAYGQDLVWSQGRIHFTPSAVILQPPYYVDQLVSQTWAPVVLETDVSVSENKLDAVARMTEDGRAVNLYAVNDSPAPIEAAIAIDGFPLRSNAAHVAELAGDPEAENSPERSARIAPHDSTWTWRQASGLSEATGQRPVSTRLQYRFPAHSFTVLRFQ